MTGGMAYEALNNIGHSGQRVIIVLNDNGRSYAPTDLEPHRPASQRRDERWPTTRACPTRITEQAVAQRSPTSASTRCTCAASASSSSSSATCPYVGPQAEKGVEAFKAARPRVPAAAVVLRGARRALRRPDRRPRHRGARARVPQRRSSCRPRARSSCTSLTQKGRGYPPAEDDDEKHLHDAPVFDPLVGPPQGRAHRVHAGVRRGDHQGGRGRPAHRRHHRGDARARPGCSRSRTASPTASSTSASPSSTPSPAPPAWRWAACARSWRSTRRSSTGRGTRSCTTSRCTGCRWSSASTAPASPAPTGRATTASTTWRCCRRCPGMRVLAPSSAQELQQMLHDAIDARRRRARSPSATRSGAARAGRPSTRSASGCTARELRDAATARVCILAIGKMVERRREGRRRPGRRGHRRRPCGTCAACAPLDPEMIADAAAHRAVDHGRGRRPRRRHRHDDRRSGRTPSRRRRAGRGARASRPGSSRRASPTASSPSSGSTPTASRRRARC